MSKILPHNLDIEKAVLGAIMLENGAMGKVFNILTPDTFYHEKHAAIFSCMTTLFNDGDPIDILTVGEQLVKMPKWNDIKHQIYVSELTNSISTGANIETHALLLKEYYVRRTIIEMCRKTAVDAYASENDVFDTYDKLLSEVNRLNSAITVGQELKFDDVYLNRVEELKRASNDKTYKTGIPIGISEFDNKTSGLQKTDLVIIAARPGMGKTAFIVDAARKQAISEKKVGIFSLEMAATQLVDRLIAQHNSIELGKIRNGGMKYPEWQRLDDGTKTLAFLPIYINDKGGLNINTICATAKNWKLKHGIDILYIDYLQLITGNNRGSREQEVSEISRRLKQLAKDLNIPVVALSQLSREVEKREDKMPILSDLRESGSIEQDADMVIFLHRQGYYNDDDQNGLTTINVAKFRNGKTGFVKSRFVEPYQQFNDFDEFNNYLAPQGFSKIQQEEPFDKF